MKLEKNNGKCLTKDNGGNQSLKLICKTCKKSLEDFSMSLLILNYTVKDGKRYITSTYVCHKGICDQKQERVHRSRDYSFELDDLIKANTYIEHINEFLNKDDYDFINESVLADWKSIISKLYPYVIGNISEEDKIVLKLNGII